MANGLKGFKGAISDKELERAKRAASKKRLASEEVMVSKLSPKTPKNGRLKKLLGMTKRPTTAGQEKFGDVGISGRDFKGAISERELEEAKRAAGY